MCTNIHFVFLEVVHWIEASVEVSKILVAWLLEDAGLAEVFEHPNLVQTAPVLVRNDVHVSLVNNVHTIYLLVLSVSEYLLQKVHIVRILFELLYFEKSLLLILYHFSNAFF